MEPTSTEILQIEWIESPVGLIEIRHDNLFLHALHFVDKEAYIAPLSKPAPFGVFVRQQIDAYFNGTLITFDIPVRQHGTAFQQKVWELLQCIPLGTTISYATLAKQIGDINATRAVAAANGKNNILIVIPCHRVIGKDGTLTGYSAGIERKKWLLQHELNHTPEKQLLF